RLSLVQGASLRVNRLRSSDEGWYYCRILFLTQPYDSHNGSWIYLSVSTPPSLRRTPPPVLEILLGEPAHLRCEAGGRPEPLISWSKDGQMLPPPAGSPDGQRYQVTNGSLKIEAVDRGSAGIYTCEARSEEGAVTHSTRLLIQGPPTIILPPGNVTVNYTQEARFSCRAEAYPGNLTYSWFKDGVNVHHHSSLHNRVTVLSDGSLLVRDTVPQDSGSYTCVPSNGLASSPKASGILSIFYPAYVQNMPRLTVLPVGMQGHIACPVMANPPLLHVNWTKNGAALELNKIPGWYQDSAGTIVIAMGNDDALGEYTCTPYNSYGTLGQSSPTHVILKDPPRFVNRPAKRYEQEVGRELRISCSTTGDPEPVVTWNKAGGCSRCPFQVLADGTLCLRSLRKCHHGDWACEGRNNLTHITAWTTVLVLGTSPHAVRNVTVRPDVFAITVSWEPGFGGGQPQQFTVWFRQMTHGPHDWIIRMVPTGNSSLRVGGLWPDTEYQFSVLAQSERGSGPFSPILNIWTLGVPMTMATPATAWASILLPPQDLTANRTARGILLYWVPPPPPSRLPLGYLLEYRRAGNWAVLHSAIPAQQNQLLLKGLVKDVCYQLRMISLSEDLVSEPSNIINVSTAGMSSYPDGNRILEPLSHPVRAGIIAGACFLACAVIVSVLVSYIMKMRRERRRQNSPIIFSRFQKAPNLDRRSDSPDSLLKLKLESSLYESLERVSVPPRGGGVVEGKRARHEAHPGRLETIRRGPDGRFVVPRELGSGRWRPSSTGPGPAAKGGLGHRLRRPGPPGEEEVGRGPPPGLGPSRAGFA
ncbi:protein turtle homolog A-like, partial [Carcharodon carcharias]|uniref:protein turtle homolog A-like n=1 Tax=Carcharodon carcharias TaxID=13397 RepID=UPI001B7F211C